MKLRSAQVLAFDCQATGSNPSQSALLEIGWAKARASNPFDLQQIQQKSVSYLVQPPNDLRIPEHVQKITGIDAGSMNNAITRKTAWQKLRRAASITASANNEATCRMVIHFSRYEERFIRSLHEEFEPGVDFPFSIFCTHEIFARLHPGLPRKGLRAVSGYFGLSLPTFRRSSHHAGATAFIWHRLVDLLQEKAGIMTFSELTEWMEETASSRSSKKRTREYPMERNLRMNIPEGPGIYKMYRSNGDILYIGKAKSLKRRVNSYFQKQSRHSEHILEMLSQAKHITTSPTESVIEAALRETDEIKRHSPPYNIALREGERQIVFFSKDLLSYASAPTRRYSQGPFASPELMTSWVKLVEFFKENLGRDIAGDAIPEILGCRPEYAPDTECFLEGALMFKAEYANRQRLAFSAGAFRKIGSLLWKERLDELAAPAKAEEARDEEEATDFELKIEKISPDTPPWTPERVVRVLKSIVRRGAYEWRRSRWFCRLSESTIAWDAKDEKMKKRHVIFIESGRPRYPGSVEAEEIVPVPKGHFKSFRQRQMDFDLATFDRMRVLTTEMKRIVDEGRFMDVRLGPRIIVKQAQLQRMLRWV